jgi:small subunit ribosomal protein S16
MLKIRMQRIGRKNDPAFRIVVTEKTTGPKSGKFIERLGFYHAKTGKRDIDADRAKHWLSVGALPSDTIRNFLIDLKIISDKKINHIPTKKTQEGQAEIKAAAEAAKPAEKAPEAVAEETPEVEAPAEPEAEAPAAEEATPEEAPAA